MPTTKSVTARRPKGHIEITTESGVIEADTLCCVHCRKHWVVEPGSGRRRGFCMKCGGPTCGCAACDECVPFEKRLDQMEAAALQTRPPRDWQQRPQIIVAKR